MSKLIVIELESEPESELECDNELEAKSQLEFDTK